MNFKLIGAVFVVVGCGGVGYALAAAYRREIRYLYQLIGALEKMEWELQYKMTPLPELCRMAADTCSNLLKKVFIQFAQELNKQIFPDAERCMRVAIDNNTDLPQSIKQLLQMLSSLLGKYDLSGQLQGLQAVRSASESALKRLESNKDVRTRNYQTLGFCAGAAIAIMLI